MPILRFCVDQYCSRNIIPYRLTCVQGKEFVSWNVAQGDHSALANWSAIAMQMHADGGSCTSVVMAAAAGTLPGHAPVSTL